MLILIKIKSPAPFKYEFAVAQHTMAKTNTQTNGSEMQEMMCVEKAMTKPVIVVNQTATLAHAAKMMLDNRISGLPVVGPGGNKKVLGDEHIRQDILAGLSSQSWSKNGFVRVKVDHGVAELSGTIFDERERQAIIVATENVHGIVTVVDQIVWVDALSGAMLRPP